MKPGPALDNLTSAIAEICRSGHPPHVLRDEVLPRLRRAVPFDAAFWTTADPATLLFTQPHQQEIPPDTIPYFIHNEFLEEDVNKWTALARSRNGVGTLERETGGDLPASARYRELFRPLGFGDELRAVMRVGGACWGYVCLHRAAGTPFSNLEVDYVRRIAPVLAEGIRAGLLVSGVETADAGDAPGLVVIAPDGSMLSSTDAGELWLEALGRPRDAQLPAEVLAVAARVRSGRPGLGPPRLRARTPDGRWAVLHASRMNAPDGESIAVIIEQPSPVELAPIVMMAYGLTEREQTITALVCRGLSTAEITARLHITANTVQDHLKSIFSKTDVSSRRELVATILQEQYLPRALSGQPLAPSGFYRA